jgi:hypothetical protein
MPSIDAMIVAVPADTPATAPDDVTVAIAGEPELQVIGRPGTMPPPACRPSAVNVTELPSITLAVAGVTRTCVTGRCVTVTATVADRPPLLAATNVLPTETAEISPAVETVATDAFWVVQ